MSIKLSNSNDLLPTSIRYNRRGGISNVRTNFRAFQLLSDIGGIPTAAYSVRKVVSGYGGAVVMVRRTVGGTTVGADVLFDLNNTISLDSPVTITSGTSSATTLGEFVAASGYTDVDSLGSPQDAFVTTWYDQAGSNDATQTTAGSQPKIYDASTGLVTENGKAALDFDGSDDYLEATSLTATQPSTYFITYRYDDISDIDKTDLIDGSVDRNLIDLGTGSVHRMFSGTSFTTTISATLNQEVSYNLFNGVSSEKAINGGTAQTGDASTGQLQGLLIGARNGIGANLDGRIQELIIYNSDKSSARTDIESNIASHFGITLS